MTDDDLIQAYLRTSYRVYPMDDESVVFEVRVGRAQPELDLLIADSPAPERDDSSPGSWSILTAYNPWHDRPSEEENETAQMRLKATIDALGLPRWNACGVGDQEPPFSEPMLSVGHVSREQAMALGRQFRQLAIVYCEEGAEAELILLK